MEFGRSFQNQLYQLAIDAGNGVGDRKVITDVTPGGGKTGGGAIFGNTLLHTGAADFILWFTPRTCLNEQVRDSFCDPRWQIGGVNRQIRYNKDNESPLIREGYSGVVQTYDALRNHIDDLFLPFVRLHNGRGIGIFDELQGLADDDASKTREAAKKLWNALRYTLGMSGLLYRGDSKPIPFVRYLRGDECNPPLSPADHLFPQAHVSYSLRQAIADVAVCPIEFHLSNGKSRFECDGKPHLVDIERATEQEYARAMDNFLYANHHEAPFAIIQEMLDHWAMKCRAWNYRSKYLIVADRIDMANAIYEAFRGRYRLCIATTDSSDSDDVIRGFRTGDSKYPGHDADGIVSVGKVYIGLDVPPATHMAFLRNFRTFQYLLQAAQRTGRIDRLSPVAPELQRSHFFAPNDPKMQEFRDWVRNETTLGLADRDKRNGGGGGGGGGGLGSYTRISAVTSGFVISSMTADLPLAEVREVESLQKIDPSIAKIPADTIAVIMRRGIELGKRGSTVTDPAPAKMETAVPLQVAEEEDSEAVNRLVAKAARIYQQLHPGVDNPYMEINLEIMRRGDLPPKGKRSPAQMKKSLEIASQMCSELEMELRRREEISS